MEEEKVPLFISQTIPVFLISRDLKNEEQLEDTLTPELAICMDESRISS